MGYELVRSVNTQKSLQAQEAVQQKQAKVAADFVSLLPGVPAVTDFTLAVANANAADQLAVLFNTQTLVTGLTQGADITSTLQNGATYANFVNTLGYRPFTAAGFTYTVSAVAQFNLSFTRYYSNGTGTQSNNPINPFIAQQLRQMPANPNVLSLWIPVADKLEAGIAYTVTIDGTSTVYLTWSVVPMSQVKY